MRTLLLLLIAVVVAIDAQDEIDCPYMPAFKPKQNIDWKNDIGEKSCGAVKYCVSSKKRGQILFDCGSGVYDDHCRSTLRHGKPTCGGTLFSDETCCCLPNSKNDYNCKTTLVDPLIPTTTTTTTTPTTTTTTVTMTERTTPPATSSTTPATTTTTMPTTTTTSTTEAEPPPTKTGQSSKQTMTPAAAEESSNLGLILGLLIPAVVILILLSVVGMFFYFRRRKPAKKELLLPTQSESKREAKDYSEKELPADMCIESPTTVTGNLDLPQLKRVLDELQDTPHAPALNVVRPATAAKLVQMCTFTASNDMTMYTTAKSQIDRPPSTDSDSLLRRLVANGPRQFEFDVAELIRLLEDAKLLLERQPMLVEAPLPAVVYGDMNGQYRDLLRWLQMNGWPPKTRSIFLGNYVDKGPHSLELLALLLALKLAMPNHIYLVRGSNETDAASNTSGFHKELSLRFPNKDDGMLVYSYFSVLFSVMPVAVLIGKRILGVHGGISPRLTSLDDIRAIPRPLKEPKMGTLACDLLWSESDPAVTGFKPAFAREHDWGSGQLFGKDKVVECCTKLNIDMIVRAHESSDNGYTLFAGRKLLTVFSAPAVRGLDTEAAINIGACLTIDKDMNVVIKRIKATESYREMRVAQELERDANL